MTLVAALTRLAEAAADAVCGVLGTFCPGQIQPGDTEVVAAGGEPLAGFPVPMVATSAVLGDGSGGTLVVMTVAGAKRLSRAMAGMAQGAAQDGDAELEDHERSAVSEAMGQMLAAANRAAGEVAGEPIDGDEPVTQVVEAPTTAEALCAPAPHATVTELIVLGEPVRLIQLVPASIRVRMGVAPDDLGIEVGVRGTPRATEGGTDLSGITMRVSAELGRTRMHAGRAVALPAGTVVELDADVDAPIELLVNSVPFATGRLLVTEDGEWAVQVDRVADLLPGASPEPAPTPAPAAPAITAGLG